MSIYLDDLSPAALETLADLIEERLENDQSQVTPVTWHEAQARQNAVRELGQAMADADPTWVPSPTGPTADQSLTVH